MSEKKDKARYGHEKKTLNVQGKGGTLKTVTMEMMCGAVLIWGVELVYKADDTFPVIVDDLGWDIRFPSSKIVNMKEGDYAVGKIVNLQSSHAQNMTWDEKLDNLYEYLSDLLEVHTAIVDEIIRFFKSCWYYTNQKWSIKEAKRLPTQEYGDTLISKLLDTHHSTSTCRKEPLPITLYPQQHHHPSTLTKLNELEKYSTVFQYWRQLKFLREEGKKFNAVFAEGLCDGYTLEHVQIDTKTKWPDRFDQLTPAQMHVLYTIAPVFIALQMGWIHTLLPTSDACELKKTEEVLSLMMEGKLRNMENDAFLYKKREQSAADRVLAYLKHPDHRGHRILLIYGTAHDFRPYFMSSPFRMCSVRSVAIEPLPFVQV